VKFSRRRILREAAGAAMIAIAPRIASAQAYPTRPVRLISGFPPGGPNDIVARLIGQWLSQRLGQQFVVENRPGAAGNIATEVVVRAAPDGYTLLLVSTPNAINATLYDALKFNFRRDIAPVAAIMRVPNLMVVHPSVPAETVPQFIAYAKANPHKLVMASSGNGSSGHISGELFKMRTGVDILHVPYRGGAPALTDLIAGRVQVFFTPMPTITSYLKAGTLRVLAMTAATRSALLPDIPAMTEFVPGYEASTWFGIGAPSGTSTAVVETLNHEVNAGLLDANTRERLVEQGGTVMPGSPADFASFIADETEKWAKVVRYSGARTE
jgi:tripartite-type tricarboxylate transporter receptor subunit TctC